MTSNSIPKYNSSCTPNKTRLNVWKKKIQVKHAHTSTNGILINAKEKK